MARDYAQIYAGIWRDPQFRALPQSAQWTYLMLITQGDITSCGVLPYAPTRWASFSDDTTPADLEAALQVLVDRRFIVIDPVNVELLIRTFVKWDGGAGNSKRVLAILAAANAIVSSDLRAALAVELDRLGVLHTLDADPTEDAPSPPVTAVPDRASDAAPDRASDTHPDTPRVPVTERNHNPEPGTLKPESGTLSVAARRDTAPISADIIEALCNHLADRIEGNGARRPTVTAKWRTACRLMLTVDDRTPEQARAAIDWCQNSEFWRANVLSMPKLRERYDQLSLQARRERERPPRAPTGTEKVRGIRDAAEHAKQLIRQQADQHALPSGA